MSKLKEYADSAVKTLGPMVGSLLVVEYLNNTVVSNTRERTCRDCPFYNPDRDQCKVCKCFVKEKVLAKTNYDPFRGGEIVITHCPMGYWDDNDIAELYRVK